MNYALFHDHHLLNSTIDDLSFNQFFQNKTGIRRTIPVDSQDVRKCIWLASVLASSDEEEHRRKVQLFAALIFLQNSKDENVAKAAYLLFSRSGNLTAARFLEPLFKKGEANKVEANEFRLDFGQMLNFEVIRSRQDKIIQVGDEEFVTTKFQKFLWESLDVNSNISISAPTSSGKSFIIKKFIKNEFRAKEEYYALYIVPSRALLNQVSSELRVAIDIPDVEIRTAFLEESAEAHRSKKLIYILTPERCLRLLQQREGLGINFNLIFVDEIQNLEDEQGRGTLFEYVLRELVINFPTAKIVSAGPYITESDKLHQRIFGNLSDNVETTVSPVFQIKTIVRPDDKNKLKIILKTLSNREQSIIIDTEFDLKKNIAKSIGDGLPDLIHLFGKTDQNIIYSSRTDYVEAWALKFAERLYYNENEIDKETADLIDFLSDEIHPKYYLIKCLRQKTTFHHSKLPDIVRKEIEDGFLDGRIKHLFCTSTLLEGVNLPANNLFVVLAKKQNEDLTTFEFGNLIGRAGRIKDSLYGTIYCIERNDEDGWAADYYNSHYAKEVHTASEKSLIELPEFIQNLGKPILEVTNVRDANTSIFFRHKFIADPEEVSRYLENKGIIDQDAERLKNVLRASISEISMPIPVLKYNPSIDPVLQDKLYKEILKTGINVWVLHPNKNFYRKIKRADKSDYKFEDLSLFWQLTEIFERLDGIFQVQREAYFKYSISLSIAQMCVYGLQWIENLSYREIIEKDLNFNSNHINPDKRINPDDEAEVNKRINEIIKINSTIVSHVLVKYLKLLNDILGTLLTEDEVEKFKFSLALPTMMELGTTEPLVMQLISRGISRSVALKVFSIFKQQKDYEQMDIFIWLSQRAKLNLKPIYNRYLAKLKFLKSQG